MKKIHLILIMMAMLSPLKVYAQKEICLDTSESKGSFIQSVIEGAEKEEAPVNDLPINKSDVPVTQNGFITQDPQIASQLPPQMLLFNALKDTAKSVYNLEIERTDIPSALLKDQMTFKMEKGPIDNVHIWSAVQMNGSVTMPESGNTNSRFDVGLINVIIDAQMKNKKDSFRIMLDPTYRSAHHEFLGTFFQDMYFETRRIPHTSVLVGNSRPGVGIEGAQSPFTLPFVNRSQLSRNLSNIRKFGVRVRGDYSLMDYDAGVYSSSTNFTSFFPGHEVDGWINFKPLGKTDGRYGKLVTGGGISAGEKHGTSYNVSSAYVGYDYKKFWTKFEYAHANGSNGGSGLTNKRAQGWFATAGYHINKKWEVLARYDQFDPDRAVNNNSSREYTAGVNYYVKGQALKLIFNYVYCQFDNKMDSHRLMMGTQIVL